MLDLKSLHRRDLVLKLNPEKACGRFRRDSSFQALKKPIINRH